MMLARRCEAQPGNRKSLFSAEVRRRGQALLDQQMWCWGCDARSLGNLLLAYGFERRPSVQPHENSAYTVVLSPSASLTLWGFGLLYACDALGSILLLRARFDPRYAPEVHKTPAAWSTRQLPSFRRPHPPDEADRMRQLCVGALGQVAAYERWLVQRTPQDYRANAVQAWPQRRSLKGVPAGQMADAWDDVAAQLALQCADSKRIRS
jgi:hypothetical protein